MLTPRKVCVRCREVRIASSLPHSHQGSIRRNIGARAKKISPWEAFVEEVLPPATRRVHRVHFGKHQLHPLVQVIRQQLPVYTFHREEVEAGYTVRRGRG